MYCMTPTRYDLRAWGRWIKTILKNFPNIYTYLATNLRYITVVISKSAHPILQYIGINSSQHHYVYGTFSTMYVIRAY
jgi:hypothetical protein